MDSEHSDRFGRGKIENGGVPMHLPGTLCDAMMNVPRGYVLVAIQLDENLSSESMEAYAWKLQRLIETSHPAVCEITIGACLNRCSCPPGTHNDEEVV